LLLSGASTSERVPEKKTKIITYRASKSEGLKQQIALLIFYNNYIL